MLVSRSIALPKFVLVGHSASGYQLLKKLAKFQLLPITSIDVIAAPFPGGDLNWTFDGFALPVFLDRM